jgi:hypothetical protein
VYLVIAAPPLLDGAVNVTLAEVAETAVAVPIVGAPGAVTAVVFGNTAVTVAELVVTDVAPETVKKFELSPVRV